MSESSCLFCKIVAGQIPSDKVYEDDEFLAFRDIRPAMPVHVLVIPKAHVVSLQHIDASHEPMLGRLLGLCSRIAADLGLADGWRTQINTGAGGGQEVFHLHVHIMGRPRA
ncbi:histidine triad nucleotide-binding protein [Amphibiibacter pelophylacis]|uniref:Histidine triad nucleotide-binding protein n=1 Tax=Amphibiibacter pelophylacis TaxID=1799477 RepID=A0ACC6P168_9BURK